MLGDLFEQKNDFYKGHHYGGRRQFLTKSNSKTGSLRQLNTSDNSPSHLDLLMPPEDFRTRRQARRIALHKMEHAPNVNNLSKAGLEMQRKFLTFEFSTLQRKYRRGLDDDSDDEDEEMTRQIIPEVDNKAMITKAKTVVTNADRFIKAAKKAPVLNLQHFASTDPSDWTETYRAGVHVWIHNKSGEVSTVCPWSHVHLDKKPKKRLSMASRRSFEQDFTPRDTGSVELSSQLSSIRVGGSSRWSFGLDGGGGSSSALLVQASSSGVAYSRSSSSIMSDSKILLPPLISPYKKEDNNSRPNTGVVRSLGEGTGSLAYDSHEVEDLFKMLDDMKKKSPTKATPLKVK